MEGFQQIWIALACLPLCSITINVSEVHQHPPVLEGTTLTFTCSGTTQSADRSIRWEAVRANQTKIPISTCHSVNMSCENTSIPRYILAINMSNGNFTSSLTISNVAPEDQNTTFRCLVIVTSLSQRSTVKSWVFPKVFYAPDNLVCNASLHGKVFINVTCVTAKVYPGIQCELIERVNNNLTNMSEKILYDYNLNGENRYNPATCSALIRVSVPGSYRYYFTVYPGVNKSDRFIKGLQYPQLDIYVDERVGLIVEKDLEVSCPEKNKSIRVYCKSYWLGSKHSFLWTKPSFLWTTKSGKREVTSDLVGDYYYQSVIDVFASDVPEDKLVKCRVEYEKMYWATPIIGSVQVDFAWPPTQPPVFSHNGVNITGRIQRFDERNITGTFVCTIQGGKPAIKSVTVLCSGQNNIIFINKTGIGSDNFVSFNLSDLTDKLVSCSCSGEHETKCYNATTQLICLVASEKRAANEAKGSTVIIYYIITGTIGVLFLIVLLGLVMFLRSKWQDLYSYIYVRSRCSSTIDRRAVQIDSEHPYETVNTFIRSLSSIQRVWTHQYRESRFENNVHNSHAMLSSTNESCVLSLHKSANQNYANVQKGVDMKQHSQNMFPHFRTDEQQTFFSSEEILDISCREICQHAAQYSDSSGTFDLYDLSCENNCSTQSFNSSTRNVSDSIESLNSLLNGSHCTLSDSNMTDTDQQFSDSSEPDRFFAKSLPVLSNNPCDNRADTSKDHATNTCTSSKAPLPKPHRIGRSLSTAGPKLKIHKRVLHAGTTSVSQRDQVRQTGEPHGSEDVGVYCNILRKSPLAGRDHKMGSLRHSNPRKPPVSARGVGRATLHSKEDRKPPKAHGVSKVVPLLQKTIRKPLLPEGAVTVAPLRHDRDGKPPLPPKPKNRIKLPLERTKIKPSDKGVVNPPCAEKSRKPPVPDKPINGFKSLSGRTVSPSGADKVLLSGAGLPSRGLLKPPPVHAPRPRDISGWREYREYLQILPELPPRDHLHKNIILLDNNQNKE